MHTYLICGLSVIWRDTESLVLTRALQTSIVPYLIMETSQNVLLFTCRGDISVPDAAKPSHLVAGHALNIQFFVIQSCDVLSSLPL